MAITMNDRDKIINQVCDSCHCSPKQASDYIDNEIDNLNDLRDVGDLRYEDFEEACHNLGIDNDYVEFFINSLSL